MDSQYKIDACELAEYILGEGAWCEVKAETVIIGPVIYSARTSEIMVDGEEAVRPERGTTALVSLLRTLGLIADPTPLHVDLWPNADEGKFNPFKAVSESPSDPPYPVPLLELVL